MKKYLTWVVLCLIVILAFFLRFNKVTSIPPSLNWDETSIAYNAYSILKTGKDEWGMPFPLNFKSYGEYKLPVQIYASIPGIAIFGLNELGVRVTPVIYGTLTVLLLFFLAKEISGKKEIGLIAALLLAISPWHIQLTRASFESGFSVFWVVLAVWLFVKGFKENKYWIWSIVSFAVSIYTYNAARVFSPIFIFVLFIIYRKEILKNFKVVAAAIAIFIISMLPLATSFFNGQAGARLKLVSITDDPGFVQRVNKARGATHLPDPLPRLIHNKVTHFAYVYAGNYFAHFTPDFLFIHGAGHRQQHVQGIGELYAIQAPFIILGIYFIFKNKNPWRWLLISWLLLVFIPVAITVDSIPNALRTILAVIPYEILTAVGFWGAFTVLKKKRAKMILSAVAVGLLIAQFIPYLNNYYNIYPKLYSRDWQYGYKEAVGYIKNHYNDYDLIVFSRTYGEPHMFTLFFLNWDPAKYQNDPNLVRFEANDWVWVLKFDKFYFPDLEDAGTGYQDIVKENSGKKILFIGRPADFPENLTTLKEINFLNGEEAFRIVEKI